MSIFIAVNSHFSATFQLRKSTAPFKKQKLVGNIGAVIAANPRSRA
jgi:hypothetical protein